MDAFAGTDLSTVIDTDPRAPEGGGGAVPPEPAEEAKEPRTLRNDLEHVFKAEAKKEAEPKPEVVEPKDAKEPKKPAEKPAESDAKAGAADDTAKPEKAPEKAPEKPAEAKDEPKHEGRRIDPPAKFLPDAKEKWRNTPQAVQRDIEVMARDHEAEVAKHREASERYESVRHYDEHMRQQGRDLKTTLDKVVEIETSLAQNPIAGLNAILLEAGPRKADGSPITLMDIVQHVSQQVQQNGPQAYQQMVTQPQRQAPQQNAEVEQLKRELAEIKQQQVASAVIEPFKAAHPRFEELQDDIAFFLQSGKIPASLSPNERLSAAYDMAARINPASHASPEAQSDPADRRADDAFSGSKSIKSAPGSVSEEVEVEAKAGESRRDSLLKEMRRLNAR